MATKLTTGFMRTPTYKSSLDGNTTSLNMPSVFDSITKYKNIEASKILGEYTTYTPPSKGNTSGLKAIGWSTIKGFVDYTQYATDFALAQIQTAKSGLKSSIEQLKGTSSDPMKQTVYDTYNTKMQSATTLADRQAARRERDSQIKAMNEAENFRIRSDKEYDSGTPLLATARKKAEGFFQPKVDKLTEMADIENKGWFTQLLAEGFGSTPYTVASKLNLFGFMLNFGSQEQRAIQEKMVQYQAEGRIMTPEAQQEIMTYATGSAVIEAAFEHMLPFAKGAMSITTLKDLGKFIVRQGGQESLEEILTYLGQGVLAKFTTDKMASLLDWTDEKGALITATGAGKAALAGFMMGSVYSGTAGLTGYVRTKRALKTIENSTLEEAGQPENVAKVDTAIKQDAQDQNNVDEIFDVVNDAAFTMSQNMDTETEAKVYESTVANLKQKASEQEYGSQERAETEATARTAEAHLKELYRQQQEAITQTPVEGARSPVQEQVASDTVQTVQQPSAVTQEPTGPLQAATVVEPYQKTYSEYVKDSPREIRKADMLNKIGQAIQSVGADKLIANGIMQEGQSTEQFASSIASQTSKWQGSRKERPTAIQMLSMKNLWGENAEPLRKALLAYTQSEKKGFLEKGEQLPRYEHKDAVAKALAEGKSVPQNVLAEYPDLQPKAETKVEQERVKTYDMLVEKVASGQDVTQDVKDWVNSKDPVAVKLRNAMSTDGKLDSDKLTDFAMQMEDKIKTSASKGLKLPKNFLQLLSGYTLAQQLERGEKGEAVTRYMAHLVEALEAGQPADVIKKIDEAVTRDDIWHEMLANKETVEKSERLINNAKKSKGGEVAYYKSVAEKVLNWNGDIDTTPNVTPDELVTLSKYAKYLIEQDSIGSAEQLARNLSKVLTNYGRSTQAAILLKTVFPEYKAERLVREFEKSTEPLHEKKQYFEDKVADVVGKAGQVRKDAINDVARDIDSAVKATPKPKEAKEKKTPGQMLADMVKKFATKPETDNKVADFEQRLLNRLFAKAKESMTRNMADRISRSKEDIANEKFSILAEIVLNRGLYAQVWNDAQSIIDQNTDLAENSQIVEFLRTLADPVSSEAFIQSVVTANIGMMNKSVTELAKDFFFRGDESIDQFLNELRKNMPTIDDASFEYVKTHVGSQFALKMAARRQVLRIMFEESIKKTRGKKQKVVTMQEVMIKQLMDATFYDSLRIPEIEKQFARLMGLPYLNEEMKQDIYDTMHRVAKISDPFEVENQIEAMQRRIAEQIPPTWDEKMKAIARTAMLLNPVSWLRNTASNLGTSPFYKWQDKIVNRMLKSWGNPLSQIAAEKWIPVEADSYIGKAVMSNSTAAHLERVRNKTAKYTWKQLFAYEKKYFETTWLQKATQIPNEVMNVGAISRKNKAPLNVKILSDSYMFEKYFRYALANKLNAMGYSETMTEEQRTKIMQQAMEYAGEISIIRTFRMSSIISDAIKGLNQSVMGYDKVRELRAQGRHAEADARLKAGKVAQAAIFMATPFVVTPAALITQGYRFSPMSLAVGLVRKQVAIKKGNLQMDGRDISIANQIAQGTVGTIGQFAIGMLLGALGFLDAAPPENEKEKQAWKLAGRRAYSIRTPWGSYSLDWLQPISTGLFMGAQFGDALAGFVSKDYTFGESLKQMPTVFIDNLFQNTMLDNVRSRVTSYDGKMSTVLSDNLQDSVFMFMPNLLARANKAIDPYVRDVYSGNALEVMAKRIALYVPFASLALPPKIDIWGNPTKKSKLPEPLAFLDRVIFQFASPFIRTEAYLDPVSKEVLDVFEKTKNELGNKALPGILSKVDDDMTGQDWVEYQAKAGQLSKEGVEKLISSSRYKKLSDKAKAEALDKVYRDARAKAKKEYLDNKKP